MLNRLLTDATGTHKAAVLAYRVHIATMRHYVPYAQSFDAVKAALALLAPMAFTPSAEITEQRFVHPVTGATGTIMYADKFGLRIMWHGSELPATPQYVSWFTVDSWEADRDRELNALRADYRHSTDDFYTYNAR